MTRNAVPLSDCDRGFEGGAKRGVLGWLLWSLGIFFAFVFLPRFPKALLRRPHLMPRDPRRVPGVHGSSVMPNSNMAQALTQVHGTIEQLNQGGLKIKGAWYNYPRGFPKDGKLSRDLVGAGIALAVLHTADGKLLIGSVLKLEAKAETPQASVPTPENPVTPPPPAASPAPEAAPEVPVASATGPAATALPAWTAQPSTEGQRKKIEDLSKDLELSSQVVNLILKMRYKDEGKSVATLTKGEASKLIQYLDGDAPSLPARRRNSRNS